MSDFSDLMATLGLDWWGRFGEASGTTLTDSSGNNRDGTWTSGSAPNVVTLGVTGMVSADSDTAVTLPGNAAAYGTVPYGSWMNSHSTISLGCIFRTTGTGNQYILNRWSDAGSSVQVMGIDLTTSNGVRVYIRSGGTNRVLSATVSGLRDGNRHLLALDWDGTTLRMYVDGAQITTMGATGSINSPTSTDLMVGRRNPSTTTNAFNGTLDEGWFGPGLTSGEHADLWDAINTAPPLPLTAWLWSGGVTDDGFMVAGKATVGGGDFRLAVEAGSSITTPDAYSSTLSVDADGYFSASITGLTADTQYAYCLEYDSVLDTAEFGVVTTFPAAGAPADFTWGHASCADSETNHRVFDAITARNPVMFQYTGDLHYEDPAANTPSLFTDAYDGVNGQTRRVNMHQAIPIDYVWDDHDFGGDNSDKTATAKPAAQSTYRQCVPHYDLPETDGIQHWYMIGRVAFIVTDLRSFRDDNLDTDSGSKTCLGTDQKAWFKDTLLEARDAGAGMIVWVSSTVYNTDGLSGVNYDEDTWAAFTYERAELADYIRDEGLADRVVVVVGDAHMLAYDDGTHSDFATGGGAPFPQFCAAALDNTGLIRGDNWIDTQSGSGQYGVLDFTDDGTTIDWEWTGYQVSNIAPGTETEVMSISGSVDTTNYVTFDGTVTAVTGAFTLSNNPEVTLAGTLPAVTGAFAVTVPGIDVTLAGEIVVTGAFTLVQPNDDVSLAGTLPVVTAAFSITQAPFSEWAEALLDVADTDLMFWARMADGEGSTTLHDSSGNGRHGTITHRTNGPHEAPALVGDGKATDFGGNNAFDPDAGTATIPDGGWFDVSNGWTAGVWIDMPGGSTLAQQRIFSKTGTLDASILTSGGSANVSVSGTNTSGPLNTSEPILNGRHFVVFSMVDDATSGSTGTDLRLYLDGALVSQNDPPTLTSNTVDPDEPITIGYQGAGGNQPLFGAMDEMFIVGRALTEAEVEELYIAGLAADVSLAGTVPAITSSFVVAVPADVTLDGTLPAVTGSFAVDIRTPVTLDGTLPAVTGAFTMPTGVVTFAGIQQGVQGSFTVVRQEGVTLDGTVPAVTGAFTLTGSYDITLAGEITVTGSFLIGSPPQTEIGNRASGRIRDGYGVVFYDPPVAAPPEFTVASHGFVSVRAYASVTMSGTRPVFTSVAKQQARRALDRVVVGGRDVTYYRGVVTPPPSYSLVAPLLYGPATLDLPQVSATFEQPGAGALSWCAKGKKVLVQRVDPDTLEVIATDYKGIVVAHNINGRHLQLQIGGEATGRAALIDKQPPLFFKRNDLGFWWWGGISELGLRFEPRLGIDTGIVLRNAGGMDHLSYLQDLSAKGTRRNGTQYTCMPDAHEDGGAYRVVAKDVETIDATVYLDDDLSVPDLRDDLAEQPNRAYATGVTPAGMRVKFGAYPVLRDDTPPPYPMNDDSDFGVGTVDADTDTGDGVSVMIWRLVKAGYLSLADKPGGYDSEVADAIKDLKQDALSGFIEVDGDMTPQAWAALFDASATGYSLAGTQILPAAQRSKTRKWNRTANGSVISRNDDFDPTVVPVDTTIDAGVGMTRKQIRGFARGELAPVGGTEYVGTITFNSGALIRGDHTPGDPITEADVMDVRELRPGMNLSAPLFGGGRLLHVAGLDRRVSDTGVSTMSADVDTQARDTMKVWQVIARNRESRRNPARAWLNSHRSSALTKDSISEFDEIGGVLDDRVDLAGGGWTVFPVVAGQEGNIRSLRLVAQPPTEYVVAVFGRQIQPSRLADLVGNPLTKRGKRRWADEDVRDRLDEDHVLLYTAGEKRAPCGYFPGTKFPEDTLGPDEDGDDDTDEPDFTAITGRWEDDASFSYHTFGAPVLWVAVFAAEATHLSPGRIMWPQLEAGS